MESDRIMSFRSLCARDLMERDVITVTPETRLLDVHRLFVEEEIHGAPVVDDNLVVHGVVSTLDLLRLVRDEFEPGAGSTTTTYFRGDLPYSSPDWQQMPEDIQDRMQRLTAADAMSRTLVGIGPDATIHEIAARMLDQHVHRLLVLEGDMLLGVVTTFDLMRALAQQRSVEMPSVELPHEITHTGYSR